MTDPRQVHLSFDDLDSLPSGSESGAVREHLLGCAQCRDLAAADQALVRTLEGLPQFAPSAQFVDRVMSRVTIPPIRARRSIWELARFGTNRRAVWRIASVTVTLLVAIGVSVLWTLANRDLLSAWGSQIVGAVDGWIWLGLRTMAASVTAQPWYGAARDLLGTPARLALATVLFTVTYIAGVIALRRLVALPSSRPMPHANW